MDEFKSAVRIIDTEKEILAGEEIEIKINKDAGLTLKEEEEPGFSREYKSNKL
jgi:hypothetical protein